MAHKKIKPQISSTKFQIIIKYQCPMTKTIIVWLMIAEQKLFHL